MQYPDDILRQIGNMEQWYEEKILYIVRDSFEEYYMSFLIPEEYRKGIPIDWSLYYGGAGIHCGEDDTTESTFALSYQ